jgi:transketolase
MKEIEKKAINTLRFLAVDAIQKANSGHPGMPMGCAPIAFLLYSKIMKHNPKNPKWINRDRFVLSAGHGSMLLYGILHLTGYEISLEDLKNFRQWGSITPGHPEFGLTPGVETTTGPLGQGFSNAVGMATAEKHLGAMFNKEDIQLLDHYIYVIAGDGDLMEGISHETAAFAGHNKLDNLIVFYDNNKITIDGSTDLAMSEDVAKRFEAYGWHVQHVTDVNDLSALESAVKTAKAVAGKPHLIITDTHIGYGSPHKQDTASVHGSPLGEEEVRLTKKNLGWDENKEFFIPEDVKEFFESLLPNFQSYEDVWQSKFDAYQSKYPTEAREFKRIFQSEIPELKWEEFKNYGENVATRSASGKVLNSLAEQLPELFGGSADLHPSNNTYLKNYKDFSANNYLARNIHFGIREHGMAAIMNGMAYYGGIIPYGGTFLVFSDYLRPAIRLAAMSHLRVIYVFTHDSIGLGEDGPTHQPIEHLASLRAIPGLIVLRPADANETVYAWKIAIETKNQPVALILSRQKLPILDRGKYTDAEGTLKGAYILKHEKDTTANIIIIATGSEVALALEAAEVLEKEGKSVRVVSMPSTEIFEMQSDEYKREVLPENIQNRIIIEAGVSQGWEKYAGCKGKIISVEKYGASAPYKILFEKYGFTVEKILETVQEFF